ncbi:MAG: alpha/beta fold hydrolase [Bdellovibrionales bacterium]
MLKILVIVLAYWGASPAFAKTSPSSGFVEIRPGAKLYVEHYPAQDGKPTLFLLNGLTYSTRQYRDLVEALIAKDPGLGIVTYDMEGMGRTLIEKAPARQDIPIENQVRDLRDLVQKLNIEGPVSVAGLSYGGAVALLYASMYPDHFDNFIPIAPFLERLETQDQLLKKSIAAHRMMFPFDPRTDDELYDFYLRQLVYTTYPSAEPIVLENPYKLEAVYRMVKGAKHWNAVETAPRLPNGKIHLMAAVNDQYVFLERILFFWNAVPDAAKASFLKVQRSKHKIPEEWPKIVASWLLEILNNNPDLHRGLTFEADPYQEVAISGQVEIPLGKEVNCESLLRTVPESGRR